VIAPLCVGCGSEKITLASVAGQVTLDGEPLPNVTVYFQPIHRGDEPASLGEFGPGSYGKTDAQGRYSLLTIDADRTGAKVGTHVVTIFDSPKTNPDASTDKGTTTTSKIPTRYWVESELRFEVKPEGHKDADFHLKTK
jgi:hypothetical protein